MSAPGPPAALLPANWRELGLQALYDLLPNGDCDGCDGCGGKCAGDVPMTWDEFERIRAIFAGTSPGSRPSVGPFDPPCRFRDGGADRCTVYPARPLVCRLFGLVEWLPCPLGRWGTRVPEGPEIMAWYADQELHSYPEWCTIAGTNAPDP